MLEPDLVCLQTSIAISGQLTAQSPQPLHLPLSNGTAGWYPIVLKLTSSEITFFGHVIIQ
jgi:hypothetical protein